MEATLDALEAPAQPAGTAAHGAGAPAQQTPAQPGAGPRPHSAQVHPAPVCVLGPGRGAAG